MSLKKDFDQAPPAACTGIVPGVVWGPQRHFETKKKSRSKTCEQSCIKLLGEQILWAKQVRSLLRTIRTQHIKKNWLGSNRGLFGLFWGKTLEQCKKNVKTTLKKQQMLQPWRKSKRTNQNNSFKHRKKKKKTQTAQHVRLRGDLLDAARGVPGQGLNNVWKNVGNMLEKSLGKFSLVEKLMR